MQWLVEQCKWVFSGVGVAVAGLFSRKGKNDSAKQIAEGNQGPTNQIGGNADGAIFISNNVVNEEKKT